MRRRSLFRIVLHDRIDAAGFELFPSFKKAELDDEGAFHDLSAEFGNQLARRRGRSTNVSEPYSS